MIGLCLLSINNQFNLEFGMGEALIIGMCFAYALQIIMISKFAPMPMPLTWRLSNLP